MPGNPFVRFDEGESGSHRKVSPSLLLHCQTHTRLQVLLGPRKQLQSFVRRGTFGRFVLPLPLPTRVQRYGGKTAGRYSFR